MSSRKNKSEPLHIDYDTSSVLLPEIGAQLAAALAPATASWHALARPEQLAPAEGQWNHIFYLRGARASGKTWAGSNLLADLIKESPPGEWAVLAPWYADARDVCMESSTSGLITALGGTVYGGKLVTAGPLIRSWNRALGHLYLKNGSTVFCDGANDGALNIQGKNLRGAWCDEIGRWKKWQIAWSESVLYAVRIAPARIIATGTPKANMPARTLIKQLLEDETVGKSHLKIEDNESNLSPNALAALYKLRGTRLARQELGGELLEDVDNALWSYDLLESVRVEEPPTTLLRVVIAVDPAGSSEEGSDETGIIVMALGDDNKGYVLADLSGRYSPSQWAQRVVNAYYDYGADLVIGEVNNGWDMVLHTIQTVDLRVPFKKVVATRGKALRAEPVAAAYEQRNVYHVGDALAFEALESQMTHCVIGGVSLEHDDRLDALVYAATELGFLGIAARWEDVYSVSTEPSSVTQAHDMWASVYQH